MDLNAYIDNNLMDLPLDKRFVSFKFNRDFLTLQSPEKRGGDWSYTVKFPKTKNNNTVFKNIHVQNVTDKFVKLDEFQFRATSNGIDFMEGIFRLREITDEYYEGNIQSTSISWATAIKDLKLFELVNYDGTPWTVPFYGSSASTTVNSIQYYIENTDYNTADIAFPLISYGTFYTGTGSTASTGRTNINTIEEDSLSMEDIPISVYEIKILKKIFEGQGYQVDSTLFGERELQNIVIPFTATDEYIYNYGQILKSNASGNGETVESTLVYPSTVTETVDLYYTHPCKNKKMVFQYLKTPTFNYNPHYNFSDWSFTSNVGALPTITAQQYRLPLSTGYNMDIDITNWAFSFSGIVQNSTDTIFSYEITQPNGDYFLRGCFALYIDDGDPANERATLTDLMNFSYEFYEATQPYPVTNINVVGVYAATVTGSTLFYQPYNPTGDIVVTGNTDCTVSTLDIDVPLGGLDTYTRVFTGNTRFELRDFRLPRKGKLKLVAFFPGYSTYIAGGTCGSGGADSAELSAVFSYGDITWNIWHSHNEDIDLNIARNLPDMTQLDFVKSWMNRHSLFITTDPSNKLVRFDTYDNFFLPNDFALDLTDKIDNNNNEPPAKPVEFPKAVNFKYSNDDNDALLIPDPEFGSVTVTSDNIYNFGSKDVVLPFSATKTRDFVVFGSYNPLSAVTVTLPSIASEEQYTFSDRAGVQWQFAYAPRILKLDGYATDTDGNDVYVVVDDERVRLIESVFEDTRESRYNLCFNSDNGLYNEYYERYFTEIGDSNIVSVKANINSFDFKQLQPQVPVLLNSVPYIINSIKSFDPINNKPTQIELIRKFTN